MGESPTQDAVVGLGASEDGETEPSAATGLFASISPSTVTITGLLFVMVIAFAIARPSAFLSVQNLRNVLTDGSSLLLLSIGMTFVIMTAGIDLSVGSVLVFTSVLAAKVWGAVQWPLGPEVAVGVAVAMAGGLAWGSINGLAVAKARIPSLIVTLGTLGMAYGAALLLSGGVDITTVPPRLVSGFGLGQLVPGVPYVAVVAFVAAVVASVALTRTCFGRWTAAVGSNYLAAERAGVPCVTHLVKVYAICGALAGLAGFLAVARFGTTTVAGDTTDNLAAITAVVLGGTSLFGGVGSIGGTVAGVLIPTVLQNGLVIVGVQPYWQQILVGAVLIVAVYVDIARRRRRD